MNSVNQFIGSVVTWSARGAIIGHLAGPLSQAQSFLVLGLQIPAGIHLTSVLAISWAISSIVREIFTPALGEIGGFILGYAAGIFGASAITAFPGGTWALTVVSLKVLPLTILVLVVVACAQITARFVLLKLGVIDKPCDNCKPDVELYNNV